ncbi:MAG: DUF1911 domain-containing protein [Methylotenera sp.]|nr:DUF1911 domain-containing protein [Methylotenera sp.]
MIRAPMGDQKYWDEWVEYGEIQIEKEWGLIKQPSQNPVYDPQYTFDTSKSTTFRYLVSRYSRGDAIPTLSPPFAGLLDAWELSNKLAAELNANLKPGEGWDHRHLLTAATVTNDTRGHNDPRSWIFELSNLNHYNWCFWLVGLALSLDIPDDQWQRLLALIGSEGEDILLDKVIASRQPNRKIGAKLLHKKPYARLLKAIEAKDKNLPKTEQATLLKDFVENWYTELARKGNAELWWYIYGDAVKNPLTNGSYFGRWCIEAVAAVKAFDLDDSLCLGQEHYPGDLLRPSGPSTHPVREEVKTGLFKKLFGK